MITAWGRRAFIYRGAIMSIENFKLGASDISFVGDDLSRPECVLAQADGTLWISDNRGGVTRRDADGKQTVIGALKGSPNGIAITRDGSLLVANMETCCLEKLNRDGTNSVLHDATPGAVNFVLVDPTADRLWITISTRQKEIGHAARNPQGDGSILLMQNDRVSVAAEGINFTNEVRVDRAGRFLYAAETALGRILRFPIGADGALGEREVFGPAPLFDGALVDGIAFDSDGNLWVTEIGRNSLHVLTPDGEHHCVFEDPDGKAWKLPTSIAFGGPDMRTAYLGSLVMKQLATFCAPVAGEKMAH